MRKEDERMIFKGKKKQETRIDVAEEEQFLKRFRGIDAPILILDERWHQIFPDGHKSPEVRQLEIDLRESFKRQAKLSEELQNAEETKQQLMQRIINNMRLAQVSEEEAKRQDKSQQLIKEINLEIAEMEAEYEEMPQRIKTLNEELLIESMRVCYRMMKKNKEKLDQQKVLVKEAEELLKERVLVKQDLQKENERMYTFMHHIFGRNILEIFDDFDDNEAEEGDE